MDTQAYDAYEQELERIIRGTGVEVGHAAHRVEEAVARRCDRARGEALTAIIAERLDLRGMRLLDVGCGFGELVLATAHRGAIAEGIEPDRERVDVARLLLRSYGLANAVTHGLGESLPYPSESFDIVTSQHVLEHVEDRDAVVSEMVRVTRPGGNLVVSAPNYLFPYEGHYMVKWPPLLPRPLGVVLLRLLGRDPTFFRQHIHYTTYWGLTRTWRRHGLGITNVTRELILAGRHSNDLYDRRVVRWLALRIGLYPTVTWLLKKP